MKQIMKNIGIKTLMILVFTIGFLPVFSQELTIYSEKNTLPCNFYSVKVGQKIVKPESFSNISYVHFAIKSSINIVVKCTENIQKFEISPLSYKIQGNIKKNELHFRLPGPGYYVVRVNGNKYLFLLVDAPTKEAFHNKSSNIINVTDFLPRKKRKELVTNYLQKALDEASGSGKVLFFPRGVYYTGTLQIKSNTTIYLDAGAIIKGSEDRNDYPTDEGRLESDHINRPKEVYTDNGEWMTFSRLILIDNAENVHIMGNGTIDGSGGVLRAQGKPANLIRVRLSKNVLIEDIILRDPAAWNTHIQMSENVTIRNVKIINDFNVPNTDGIDPDASRNVLIDHCFAYCNDDNIAIKTTNNLGLNQNVENIKVKDCVFLTRKSALKVGTETKATQMNNIFFENNDIIFCDRGMVLYCYDGAHLNNIYFLNNRFESSYAKGEQRPIHFLIKERFGKGSIENVLIKDCEYYKFFPKSSEIFGLDNQSKIKHVVIENLKISGEKVSSLKEANILTNEFVEDIQFK